MNVSKDIVSRKQYKGDDDDDDPSRCILQGEIQPGEQLLQKTLDVWKGPSMIITGDNDPTVPTQVRLNLLLTPPLWAEPSPI